MRSWDTMIKIPVAGPVTEGRCFDTDWSIANVARLLRANAGRGAWRATAAGGSAASVNQYYLRTASAHHLPTAATVIFMRLQEQNCWYASLCFSGDGAYLPWKSEVAELWLWALFGEDRPQVREAPAAAAGARQFTLAMPA